MASESHFSGGISIEKLDGVSSYHNWKFQIRMALTLEGLWGCVDGSDADAARGQRALARICLAVTSSCTQHVRTATSAKQAWERLQAAYEDKGLYRRVVLLRKLHRCNYSDYRGMPEYIETVMTTVQQLADIGKTIEDSEVAELLLSGLPQEFDVLVSGMEVANLTSTLSSETVRARLLQEEHRRSGVCSESKENCAFISRKPLCSYCKKTGHLRSKCFKLKNHNKRKDNKQETLLVSALSAFTSQDWVVDSGCTNHMCNNKELFSSMDINYSSLITVANSEKLECKGIGNISLSFPNNVKKTLQCIVCAQYISKFNFCKQSSKSGLPCGFF